MAQSPLPIPKMPAAVPRSDPWQWSVSVLIAVLIHIAVAAVLIVDFGAEPVTSTAPPQAAMTVELAPVESAPEQSQSEMPPGPEQVEQQVQPVPQPDRPPFDPPPEVASPPPDALPVRKSVPEPVVQQVASTADRTTAAPSSMADTQKPLRALVEGVSNDAARNANQTWESQLLAHFQRHKRYPASARSQRLEDIVYLRFTMDRTGKVLSGKVSKSHGFLALDEEVNALLRRASPLPRPPDTMGGNTIEMVVPVEFFLSRQGTRR